MTAQVAPEPSPGVGTCAEVALDDPRLGAWRAFLLAQAAVLRTLEAELLADEHLSLAEYDALVQLAIPQDRRLRMSELAERLLISRSGVTRLVDRLEAQGLVRRSHCAPDGRGAFAVLTTAGLARLRGAAPAHLRHVDEVFLAHVTPADLAVVERVMNTIVRATGRCVDQAASCLAGRLEEDAALASPDADKESPHL